MVLPAYTALFAGLYAFMGIALALYTINHRRKNRIPLGTGEDKTLERKIRCFGNFIEYTPFFVVLLLLLELRAYKMLVIALGVTFLCARLLHVYALLVVEPKGHRYVPRTVAMVLTFTCLGTAATAHIVTFFLLPR
jgi:uncharacterized protein